MDLILKAISQAPLVALFAYMWWQNRKDLKKEIAYLTEKNNQKDQRIDQLISVVDKFHLSLELIKDRLR